MRKETKDRLNRIILYAFLALMFWFFDLTVLAWFFGILVLIPIIAGAIIWTYQSTKQ